MDTLKEKITEWIKELLIGIIQENFTDMFTAVNEQVSNAASQISTTPQGWNASIFGLVQSISEEAVIPIAGIIITYVLCYELISMIVEKNNLHDLDTWMFMKFVLKATIAIYLVNYTFDITMAIFELGQTIVNKASGVLGTEALIQINFDAMQLDTMSIWALIPLVLETAIVKFIIQLLFVLIMLILYSRMIMIYMYASVSPIPFATLTNREWGSIGQNYIKGLLALAFQGFFMLLCVGIYAILVKDITTSGNIQKSLWTSVGYAALLCFMLFKTDGISKSIFGAH